MGLYEEDNAESWTQSSAPNGLECRIVRETPRDIKLYQEVWKELKLQMLQNEVDFRNLGFLDGRMSGEMGQIYVPMRGTLPCAGSSIEDLEVHGSLS